MHTKATLAIGLCVAFLAILSVLHVLEPEFNPPHLISEYQLGRFGWLMSLAFFCLGAASLALFAAARQEIDARRGRLGTLCSPPLNRRLATGRSRSQAQLFESLTSASISTARLVMN